MAKRLHTICICSIACFCLFWFTMTNWDNVFLYNDNFYKKILPIVTKIAKYEKSTALDHFREYPGISEIIILPTQNKAGCRFVFRSFQDTSCIKNETVSIKYGIPHSTIDTAAKITIVFALFLGLVFGIEDKLRGWVGKWNRSK